MAIRRLLASSAQRGSFARSVAVLAGGAGAAQAINALVSPLLTRLYTPAQLGQLGLYLAFTYVASMVLSLRYEQAIASARDRTDAARLAVLAGMLVLPLTAISAGVLAGVIELDLLGYGSLPVSAALWAVPALLLFGGFGVIRYWLIFGRSFTVIARLTLVQSLARALVQSGLGFVGIGIHGLLAGDVAGRAAGLGRLGPSVFRDVLHSLRDERWAGIGVAMRSYRKFAVFGVPSSLINAVALTAPLPLIAQLHGVAVAGLFALVQRVLWLPINVVGASVADAFHGRLAYYAREAPDRARPLFARTAVALLGVGLLPAIVLGLFGPSLFDVAFGSEWRSAGTMAQAMIPWFLAASVVSPLSRVVLVYQGQDLKLVYDVVSLALVVGALVGSAGLNAGPVTSILVLSLAQATAYLAYLALLWRILNRGMRVRTPAPVREQ